MVEHFDVVVVGAGLSGIGAGYHLQTECPERSYVILEGRTALGGTWDLFRYPGIRSDSDMFTLGYPFRPWSGTKAIADGPSILAYIRDTAREHRIDQRIRFGHQVERASWSSETATWTVEARRTDTGGLVRFTCGFLFMCSGYYDYAAGYTPEFPGMSRFRGRLVHPQRWTDDIDPSGKRVVVIGSGATAVTLVPELAKRAAHVTMLQRSPTYIISMPAKDAVAQWLEGKVPARIAYGATRWKSVALGLALYRLSRRYPDHVGKLLIGGVRKALGRDYDVDTHFTPRYGPWEQRLCLVPDGDLFEAIRRGRAEVVTDEISTFREDGILLASGKALDADLVVTATGLRLQLFGGAELEVDGERVELKRTMNYKGTMFSDVPNLAMALGYTNASWTLKADLVCSFVCRVLNTMAAKGYRTCVPRRSPGVAEAPILDFSSGYVRRALAELPTQGSKAPWKLHDNYLADLLGLRWGKVDDGVLRFSA